jgi:hypothetical protein
MTSKSYAFDPEATQAMVLAFDGICASLRVPFDSISERRALAARVIELARSGERDPVVIYGSILRERLPNVARQMGEVTGWRAAQAKAGAAATMQVL